MKKTAYISLIALSLGATTTPLWAQEGNDLNRQMEVTRAYEPTVNRASKLEIKPNMTDTVPLRPEIEYRINSSPLSQPFRVNPIQPARLQIASFEHSHPFYLKTALGYPFQSLMDLYFNAQGMRRGSVGVYLNHYGSWSKIENDAGYKAPSMYTFNRVGVLGERRWSRYALNGEVGFDYDQVSRYGFREFGNGSTLPVDFAPSADSLRQNFSNARAAIAFGDSFRDLSHFNFRVGLDGNYFSDRYKFGEYNVKGYTDLGKIFNETHEATLRLSYNAGKGLQDLDYFKNNILTVSPLYRLHGKYYHLAVGVHYTHESSFWYTGSHLFPRAEFSVELADGAVVPFAELDGRLHANGYRNITQQNPYVMNGLTMRNTSEYNLEVGIRGDISSAVTYKVYGGALSYRNLAMFANYFNEANGSATDFGNTFYGISDDARAWKAGWEFEGNLSRRVGFGIGGEYITYKMDFFDHAFGMPNFQAHILLSWKATDRLTLQTGADCIGERYFFFGDLLNPGALYDDNFDPMLASEKVTPVINVKLGAEYAITPKLKAFLEGRNLANQRLYPFSLYRDLGINVLVGAKLTF